ncbi:uncharacterized protein LOC134254740, partial [Saccostrea cucullata]|uniref:uncharacterized protein LOC134254740 n=1 Tax=Saccostrea cuccullata TaxID=36930 RepID=UPI002ED4F63D
MKEKNIETGTLKLQASIKSIPDAFKVEWRVQMTPDDEFRPINLHEETYKGSTSTLPNPILVVNKFNSKNLETYRVEVTNFLGVKVVSNQNPLRRFYKKSGSSVPFFNLSKSVVNAFSDKVANLKQILLGLGDIEANSIKAAKSSEECIELIKENNLFNPRDVIYMQYLLKEAGCNEVYEKCIEYAIKAKAMCFYENPQENGFIQVKFHICVNLQEYNEQEIACIKKTVEDILECREDEIKIAGLCNAKGFILILSIKEKYAKDLTSLNQHQCEKLKKLNVDYIIVGERKIDMESQKSNAVNIHPERFMAYMKNGKTTVRHVRGIVVGCEGAGKTTLLYRLMGKSLNEIKEIKSTRGLHFYEHIFSVKNGDLSATDDEFLRKPLIRIPASEIQQMGSDPNDDSVNIEMGIETENSSSLENNKVDQSTGKELNARQNTEPGSQKNETDDQQPTENKRRKMHAGENDGIDQQLARDVLKKILDDKENEISVTMIDFAGQFAYYACHQIYMRSEAFYVLVLDMSKDFENFVCSDRDECQGSIFSTWTYKDYLDFWLDSIKSFSGPSAQVLAVATHTEGKTGEEKDSFWETLWTLVPEDDKTRLYDRDFALGLIEMNEEAKHVLHSLKKSISEVVSQGMDTKLEVPSAWALLEHLLQTKEKPILSISDINKENKKLSEEYQLKSQEEIFDFLSFFHGHGLLLFFKEEGLRTHAVLGIQWFSNAFSKLIADKEHINRDCKRRYIEDWNHFNATGHLSNPLLDSLWKEESSYIEHKTILMSYMERLRMLVSIEGESSWYVPCMNKKPFTHGLLKQTLEKSSILCFRFTSFAMFVFYRLIAYCMSFLKWKVQLDGYKSQCLYHTAAIFETENHTVTVGIINNDIQVQVLRINDLQLKVSCKIGKSIQTALTELTATFNEKKTFQKGYKCLNLFCCEKDLTFIPENELSGSQCNCPIGKGKHKIDVQWTLGFWED